VKKKFLAAVDGTRQQLCCIAARVVERQIWVCIPFQGDDYLSVALCINTDDGEIGIILLPNVSSVVRGTINPAGAVEQEIWEGDDNSWESDNTIWTQTTFSPTNDSIMMTQTGANLLQAVGIGDSADGAAVSASLSRLSMRVGEGVYHSVITQVAPMFEGTTGDVVRIRLGQQDYFNQPITWKPYQDFIIGQTRGVDEIIDGRYVSLQFDIQTPNAWKMQGYYLKTKEAGEY